MNRTSRILARVAPADLTVADCRDGWLDVTAWCEKRCGGRRLRLDDLDRWVERKLLDLMREGVVVCAKCDLPATCVTVSSTERADRILFWRIGDDAMPKTTKAPSAEAGGAVLTARPYGSP